MSATALNVIGSEGTSVTAETMKATVVPEDGSGHGPVVKQMARPVVDADLALVRVRAASVNPADVHDLRGGVVMGIMKKVFRMSTKPVLGTDVAGVIEAVGENVTDLRPGDEIFGGCPGALAEYALGGKNFVPKPARLTFEQAGSIAIAGLTALQGLRDKAQLQPGQTVLINGASGGVGTFAVQIAKALGAEVTAVCSTRNVELVQSIGADHVIDYTKEDFARMGTRYDVVFDLVGNRALRHLRRVTKRDGVLVLSGGGHDRGHGARGFIHPLRLSVSGVLLSKISRPRTAFYIAQFNKPDLLALKDLVDAGKLTPVIDCTYPLNEVGKAFGHVKEGHARGKVVVTI